MTLTASQTTCHLCYGELEFFQEFSELPQVTSDCRPWNTGGTLASCRKCGLVQKPLTEKWSKEAQQIYAGYDIYSQSDGEEQRAFDQENKASATRSARLVDWLSNSKLLPTQGKMLDIGCGKGTFLKAFGQNNPAWVMSGFELDSRNQYVIEELTGKGRFYAGDLSTISEKFDLLVMIHALEHIPHPASYLSSLKNLLKPNGRLFIQVPELETSPFDIIVADHCLHFNTSMLCGVLAEAGFSAEPLGVGPVPRELSILGSKTEALDKKIPQPTSGRETANAHLNWLKMILQQARSCKGQLAVFGTSIGGTWLATALGDKVAFFVDEDPARIGRTHMGKPIYNPQTMPKSLKTILPFTLSTADAIANRLGQSTDIQFIIPASHT